MFRLQLERSSGWNREGRTSGFLPSLLGWPPALLPLQQGLHGKGRMYQEKMADVDDDDEGEAALIEDEAPEDSASSRSQCTVCHRSMPVTRLGLIRVRGLVLNRCPGSRKPPAPVNTCQRGNIPDIADSVQAFKLRRFSVKILKRVPRASRNLSARKLAEILDRVSSDGSESSWDRLFCFPARYLRVPDRGGHCRSLASHTNQRTLPSSSLPLIDEQVN